MWVMRLLLALWPAPDNISKVWIVYNDAPPKGQFLKNKIGQGK